MPSRKSTAAVLLETVMVAAAAAAFAFLANALSPHGLNLSRNYFPKVSNTNHTSGSALSKVSPTAPTPLPTSAPITAAAMVGIAAPTNIVPNTNLATTNSEDSEIAETDQRIKDKGLQPVDRAEMLRLYNDPRYQQGDVIFIDARSGPDYADSHIPGAYSLDRYHPEKDLGNVLTPCQNAGQVVVYCTGGECEDAEFTALFLRDANIPMKKLFVYGGGYDDWSAHHLPLEQGARNSGTPPAENK